MSSRTSVKPQIFDLLEFSLLVLSLFLDAGED